MLYIFKTKGKRGPKRQKKRKKTKEQGKEKTKEKRTRDNTRQSPIHWHIFKEKRKREGGMLR